MCRKRASRSSRASDTRTRRCSPRARELRAGRRHCPLELPGDLLSNDRMWTLIGVAVVIAGFAARVNPLLVIAGAAAATGVAAGLSPRAIVSTLGHAFSANRFVSVVFLVLPVIGLLERYG